LKACGGAYEICLAPAIRTKAARLVNGFIAAGTKRRKDSIEQNF